jgi:CRISPR-associated endonuclease/helicase Cas3
MQQSSKKVLGKSITDKDGNQITLLRHTKDVFDAFNILKKRLNGHVSNKLNEVIGLTIFLHDLGKVLPAFQVKSLGNKDYQPFDLQHDFPHSLFSLFWINLNKLEEVVEDIVGDDDKNQFMQWIISTVAYHHWRENFPDFIQRNSHIINELCKKIENKWGVQLKDNLIKEFENSSFDTSLIALNKKLLQGVANGLGIFDYATPPYYLYWLPKRMENTDKQIDWVLISGFTMLSDHFASYCEEEGDDLTNIEISNISLEHIEKRISIDIESKLGHKDFDFWQSKLAKDYNDKNVVLIAPTGYGKTEYSFLWSKGEKFFYTLPLRTAVDQIYNRARYIFDDNNERAQRTGIIHSDADVFLLGDGGESENIKLYELAKQLSFPVNISTGDQFFPYALRPPGYEKIYAKFSYSRLVIDEVQAYDPKAAAIIVKFMEDMVRLGGKFLLMTATFPNFMRKEMNRRIRQFDENFDIIDNNPSNTLNIYENDREKLEKLKKHSIKITIIENTENTFSLPTEQLDKIIESANKYRVLVIVNTIQQAQNVWNDLQKKEFPTERIDLLHSRFTKQDRNKKENQLKRNFSNPKPQNERKGRILVATQIVEASLDIDADILFTELAPMDNLVQRMGRVLRRYKSEFIYENQEPNVFIWVYQNELDSGKGYVYHKELQLTTLNILNKALNGKEIDSDENIKWITKHIKDYQIVKGNSSKKEKIAIDENHSSYLISDYDKYWLVEKLYKSIPEDGNYLNEFYQILNILDAGYMSDRKSDAHKIFREIYNAEVIPENKFDEFKKSIENFFSDKQHEQKYLYTLFKEVVLSKFLLQIPLYKVENDLYESNLAYNQLKVRDVNLENWQENKLKHWLRNIYKADIDYDNQGVTYKSSSNIF